MKDRAEFVRLIQAAAPGVRRRIAHALPPDEVDDAVQDCLLVALSSDKWEGILMPRSWMLGVADHVIRKYVRQRKYGADVDVEQAAAVEDFAPSVVDQIGDQAALEACREKIMEIMPGAGLTEREEACIRAALANQSDAATAQQIGIQCNAVRAYRSTAVRKIQAALAAKGDEETKQ